MTSNTAVDIAQSAQIFKFPYKEGAVPPTDASEILNNVMQMKVLSVEEALGFIAPVLFEAIITAGFSVSDDRLNALLVTFLRGIMYNHFHIDHPLVEYINNNSDIFDQMIEDQMVLSDFIDDELDE